VDIELVSTGPAPVPPAARQVMVAMRDGVRLATDVYRPAGPGPWPAVLVRLPYDKDGRYTFMPWLAPRFTARGYVFVVQDVRGKFRSEGEARPFTNESADGYDTIDWVSRQDWCSGSVGMFGDSYYGYAQWCAVASGHPALRAIVPRVTCADLGTWLRGPVDPLYAATYLAQYWTGPDAITGLSTSLAGRSRASSTPAWPPSGSARRAWMTCWRPPARTGRSRCSPAASRSRS
jgi:hypothetical protein